MHQLTRHPLSPTMPEAPGGSFGSTAAGQLEISFGISFLVLMRSSNIQMLSPDIFTLILTPNSSIETQRAGHITNHAFKENHTTEHLPQGRNPRD